MSANAQPTLGDILTNPDKTGSSASLADKPTASHALATAEHEEQGAAQVDHDNDVVDLGWKTAKDAVPEPLVARMPNDELWVLIRRFNKVRIYPILGERKEDE